MASDVFPRDANRLPIAGAISTVNYADVKSLTVIPFSSANTNALTVAVVDGSGGQITAFGGGTQYTDGGTPPAHPVGNAFVYDNGSSLWQAVNSTHGLPVNVLNSSLAVTGTFWQATQPISAASLPLPSGAATAAKQPALGTAGTASSDVITVQGIASMTALKVDGSGVTQPVSGTFWQATQPTSIADGSNTTLGAKADAKSTATDTTAVSIMQVLKEISFMEQNPASRAVTNAGTFATQAAQSGTWTVQPGNTANTTPWLVEQSTTLPITISRVAIAASSSGDNTLIAAQGTGKKIYVFAFELSFSGTVNAKFTDGASGTNLGGLYYGIANAGAANAITPPYYLFVGSANTALILNLSGAVAVGGAVSYFVI